MFAIITIVVIIVLTILIVWLIDKFVPKKLKPVINIVLWIVIILLGYMTFNSVYKEIKFNELKEERYQVVIKQLVDIRDTQLAYKEVNGEYASSFDSLVKFVDTAKVPITQRRDTTILDEEATRRFGGVETFKTEVLIDTLSYYSVKDSIFKGDNRYKTMMNVYLFDDEAVSKDYDLWSKNLPDEYRDYTINGKTVKASEIKKAVSKHDDLDEYLAFIGGQFKAKKIESDDVKNLSRFFTNQKFKDNMLKGKQYVLKASKLDDIPVFEVILDKSVILYDQEFYLVAKEKQVQSVDGVNGPTLKVGSMEEVNTNGNWPKNYSKQQ